MKGYMKQLTFIDKKKIDIRKGLRQGMLMFIPLLYGLLFNDFPSALLITIGTLAHVYAFDWTFTSRMRIVSLTSFSFVIAMMLGTLTSGNSIVFAIFLLVFSVIPYYIFTTLNVPGPSSTFFIIAYSLSLVMPQQPEDFLYRGAMVGVGGLLSLIVIVVDYWLKRDTHEANAIKNEYQLLQKLVHQFNDQAQFNDLTKVAVKTFIATSETLNTTGSSLQKRSVAYQRAVLLHQWAEGVYSELLELNAKGIRPMPSVIKDMIDHVSNAVVHPNEKRKMWKKRIEIDGKFDELVMLIFKIDETLASTDIKVKENIEIRSPQYKHRLLNHLTPESAAFVATMKYSLIMGVSILVALVFNLERAYWVPLSAHTVLIGVTNVASLQRALARWLGTMVGVILTAGFLSLEPHIGVVIVLLALSGAMTEALVGANYALAMITITSQVLLLSGLAQGVFTPMIAIPRFLDTTVGILIAVIGVLLIGRHIASRHLPEIMAEVARVEAQIFHYVFSNQQYPKTYKAYNPRKDKMRMKLKVENMEMMYNRAYGEISSNHKRTQYYYPAIFLLQQIHFKLTQILHDDRGVYLDDRALGDYLVVFENIAKLFECGKYHSNIIDLPELKHYVQLRHFLMQLQEIELYDYQNERNPHLLKD
ncbi:FUSC family protein [Staphylococcus hyicus]|nr:FUSC family protein [Staphylococcus hyicus]MDP4449550.1 FUSC family protein [Staphylococcus hyicus]MDP4464143.1 FUSC family protein [Staphylococcus hyicus]MDP4467472.1 FUSC family protein [Staphylococcus hyicus]MDY3697656.1 FUSC family protein [Staphylococcus hyicus]SQE48930.1 Integral membrane protein [Staphylococcus hyicus]